MIVVDIVDDGNGTGARSYAILVVWWRVDTTRATKGGRGKRKRERDEGGWRGRKEPGAKRTRTRVERWMEDDVIPRGGPLAEMSMSVQFKQCRYERADR